LAGDAKLPGVVGPAARIKATDPRFDRMICFDGDDFEKFYLRHVLGITPKAEDVE
jgi:hypothetical protein